MKKNKESQNATETADKRVRNDKADTIESRASNVVDKDEHENINENVEGSQGLNNCGRRVLEWYQREKFEQKTQSSRPTTLRSKLGRSHRSH